MERMTNSRAFNLVGLLTAPAAFKNIFFLQKYQSFVLEITLLYETHFIRIAFVINFIIIMILVDCLL